MSDDYVTVAKVGTIPEGQAIAVTVADKLVAVFCHEGKYYAITDICPHMGASLSEGHFANGEVTCPWHAWRFRVADGTWCDNPRLSIDHYDVRVVGEEIQVQGTPRRSNPRVDE